MKNIGNYTIARTALYMRMRMSSLAQYRLKMTSKTLRMIKGLFFCIIVISNTYQNPISSTENKETVPSNDLVIEHTTVFVYAIILEIKAASIFFYSI